LPLIAGWESRNQPFLASTRPAAPQVEAAPHYRPASRHARSAMACAGCREVKEEVLAREGQDRGRDGSRPHARAPRRPPPCLDLSPSVPQSLRHSGQFGNLATH